MKGTIKKILKSIIKPVMRWLARCYALVLPDMFVNSVIDPGSPKSRKPIQYSGHTIKDPEGLLNAPAETVMARWGGRNPRFFNYNESQIDAAARSFTFHKGTPRTKSFHDVIYAPKHDCLYTTSGLRIDESCVFTGNVQALADRSPERIKPLNNVDKFSQKLIYAGAFHKHFGHFLTDHGLALLWYAAANEQHPILCQHIDRFTPTPLFFDTFFKSAGFSRNRFVSFVKPVLLEEVIVPAPSFRGEHGFEVHRLIPENVAERLLVKPPERTSQPLYFSRRSLSTQLRLIVNEDKLEDQLAKKGHAIVHPEKLTLEQQINLINKHEVIIGSLGSALHGAFFDLSPESSRNVVCLSYKDSLHNNYLLIDAIKKLSSTYIASLEFTPRPSTRKGYNEQDRVLELDVAVGALREMGLL